MSVLTTRLDPRSSEFRANADAMQVLLDEVLAQQREALVAGRERYIERHRSRGKMLVRERIELLIDRDSPLLELHALAAWVPAIRSAPEGVHAIGRVRGVLHQRQRHDGEGRCDESVVGDEEPARDGDRARESVAVHHVDGVRCRSSPSGRHFCARRCIIAATCCVERK